MANLSSFLGSIFNPYNKNKLKEFQSIVKKINEVENIYDGKSQSELIQFTDQLKIDFKQPTFGGSIAFNFIKSIDTSIIFNISFNKSLF